MHWVGAGCIGLVIGGLGACSESKSSGGGSGTDAGTPGDGGTSSGGSGTGGGGKGGTTDAGTPGDGGTSSGGSGTGGGGKGGTAGASGTGEVGGGAGISGNGGGATEGIGDLCGFGCSAAPCGGPSTQCMTGYCLFDSRFLAGVAYCTLPCDPSNSPCPQGYECVEDAIDAGSFWCAEPMPLPPADLGESCPRSFGGNDCFLNQQARHCAAIDDNVCEHRYCARDPGASEGYCSTECSDRLPCPEPYVCLPNPTSSSSLCFKPYTDEDVLGAPCERALEGTCEGDLLLCAYVERYELCSICLSDYRDPLQREGYCSLPCTLNECPAGYECLEATGTPGTYCAKVH